MTLYNSIIIIVAGSCYCKDNIVFVDGKKLKKIQKALKCPQRKGISPNRHEQKLCFH